MTHVKAEHQGADRTFAEFFAGIGLVHMGLAAGGWRCVYANDIDAKKRAMYEAQFGSCPHYHVEDVWNTDNVLSRFDDRPVLATASFPCVDLSLAGHWRGIDGKDSSAYFGFLEVLRRLGDDIPKIVMLENVNGFLTSRGGADFDRAVTRLSELGYWIDAVVLDARWFVPQSRPRVFVFGYHDSLESKSLVRRGSGLLSDGSWREAIQSTAELRPAALQSLYERINLSTGWAAVPAESPRTARYVLTDFIDLDDDQSWWKQDEVDRHYAMMEAPSRSRVDELIHAGATAAGTAYRRTRRGSTRCEVRFDVAGCLRTPKGGSAKQIVVAVVEGALRIRWMSAREYARLQGAGDFPIGVPEIQALYGFGDAVCVPAIEWIDKSFLTRVLCESETSDQSTVQVA